jgi:hypothetical protein
MSRITLLPDDRLKVDFKDIREAYRAGQAEMRERAEDLMVYPIDREAVHYLPLEGDNE